MEHFIQKPNARHLIVTVWTIYAIMMFPIVYGQQSELFKFINTIQVTPDSNYLTGGFVRINYVPATDRFMVTFGGKLTKPSGGCINQGFSYKEYSTSMQETGKTGVFNCDMADAASIMVENIYYHAGMAAREGVSGWNLRKYDAVSWNQMIEIFFPLTGYPQQGDGDPMVAFVNGQIDISSQYNDNETGGPPLMTEGAATHHNFFSLDLQLLSSRILNDTPHIVGSSMIYVDRLYYFVSANAFVGDVILMTYDQNWNLLDTKVLVEDAHWSTGLAYDGQMFYLAYINTSRKAENCWYLNTRLAAFDRNWNLIEDIPVTDFTSTDSKLAGRPWVIHHDDHLYVSFDVDSIDTNTFKELHNSQAYVSVYKLAQGSSSIELVERVPKEFHLEQNYPNPFNPVTTIIFSFSKRQHATLKVYDIFGREVAVLFNGMKEPGTYVIPFNAKDIPNGVYFYTLQSGESTDIKKFVVLK